MSDTPAVTPGPRLLWIHQNYVSGQQAGNTRAAHIASALAERGFHVDVVASQVSYLSAGEDRGWLAAGIERRGRLTEHRLPASAAATRFDQRGRSYVQFLWRALRVVRSLPRPDLLYASSPPLPQVAVAILLASWWRCPLVLEVRDLWPALLLEVGALRPGPFALALEWLEAVAYRTADHCIVVAPAFAPYLLAMGVADARLSVVPSGGEPRLAVRDDAAAAAWRAAHGLEGRTLFLYAGSFNESYDLDTVLDTAEQLATRHPELVWLFAGNGRQRARVLARAAQAPWVRYLGLLPKDELLPVLWAADAGVVTLARTPLLRTVVPGKLLDAMAAGLPVLAWADGQVECILTASGAGLMLDGANARGTLAALDAFAALPAAARRAMGERGRAWVEAHMSAPTLAREAADVVYRAWQQARSAGRMRRGAAGWGAATDVAAQRSARALSRLFIGPGARTVEESFTAWLRRA